MRHAMKTLLPSLFLLLACALPPGLAAGPQDNWYLDKDVGFSRLVVPGLNHPTGIDVHDGRLYVCEIGNDRVSVWNIADGAFLFSFGDSFQHPMGIDVTEDRIYVVDPHDNTLQAFDHNGSRIFKVGSRGNGPGQLYWPDGVLAVGTGTDHLIYVAERSNNRVSVFDANGTFVKHFATNNDVRGIALGPDDKLYLSNSDQRRIRIYDQNDTYLRESEQTSFNPGHLAFRGDVIHVADQNHEAWKYPRHRMATFDKNGTKLSDFNGTQGAPGESVFFNPFGVAVDGDRLYVSEIGAHRIRVLDLNGSFLGYVGFHGKAHFGNIRDLLATTENTLLASEDNGDNLLELDENASFLRVLARAGSGDGQLSNPHQIAFGPNGRIHVADFGNDRVVVLERNGTFVRNIGSPGSFDGQFQAPTGVAVASDGRVYVSDRERHLVQVFSPQGAFLFKFGGYGTLDGQFRKPEQLVFNAAGELFVCDYDNRRIQVFDVEGKFLRKFSSRRYNTTNTFSPGLLSMGPDGLLFASGGYNGSGTGLFAFNSSGYNVRAFDGIRGDWRRSAATKDGGVWAFDGRFKFFRRTYRAFRPNPSKEVPLPELVSVSQRPGTHYLDVRYRVHDLDSATVSTALLAFTGGGSGLGSLLLPKTFVGDNAGKLGAEVPTNQIHQVTWNVGADWNVGFGDLRLEVIAKDDRELLNLHFLELPGTDANATPLTINRSPITNADLLSLWYWLLSEGDGGLELLDGTVTKPDANATTVSPATLSGKLLWLDASDLDGDGQPNTETNGSKVSIWMDKSGNDLNASQANPDHQPIYRADLASGKPTLAVSNHWMNADNVNFHAKQIFVVTQVNGTGDDHAAVLSRGGDRGQLRLESRYNRYAAGSPNFGGSNGELLINGNPGRAFPMRKMHIVSAKLGTDSEHAGHFQNLIIGRDDHNNDRWNGFISEVLVFDRFLSEPEQAQMEKYLSHKWSLPYAFGSITTPFGRAHLLALLNLREATAAEVARAKEASSPGVVNQFEPALKVGPGVKPKKVNEYGFDTGAESGFWVVPTQ